jgi:hypothetical protein
MVRVGVIDVAALSKRGDNNQRNTGPVAEEVEWLHVTGVIVSAPFIEGDNERGLRHQVRTS